MSAVTFPGGVAVRAGGKADQPGAGRSDWGIYADSCWAGWPGCAVDWPDFGLPADDAVVAASLIEAWGRAAAGQEVFVGCLGGTGRTGTLLACLAILAGIPSDHAVAWVRSHYRRSAVETSSQERWVTESFAVNDRVATIAARSRERQVDAHETRIRFGTTAARNHPDQAPVLVWAIPNMLAVTQRPLRDDTTFGGSRKDLPAKARAAVEDWVEKVMSQGVRSVVVLTSNKELAHYEAPTAQHGGLLGLYRALGLDVEHLPADDPAHDTTAKAAFDAAVDEIGERVTDSLRRLPLPALIHCSAAIDRSPPVAARVAFAHDCGML